MSAVCEDVSCQMAHVQSLEEEWVLTQDDDRGGSVTHFLVLCPRQFDHTLRSWMGDIDLSQDAVAVICHYDTTLNNESYKKVS